MAVIGNTRLRSLLKNHWNYFQRSTTNPRIDKFQFHWHNFLEILVVKYFYGGNKLSPFRIRNVWLSNPSREMRYEVWERHYVFFCGGRKAILCGCSGTSRWTKKLPRCSLHNVHLHKEEREKEHRKELKKKNHRHSPFSTVHYIMLVLGIAFSIKFVSECIYTQFEVGWTRAQWVKNLIYWFLNIWLSLHTKGNLYWIILLIITNDEIFSANNSSALIMSFLHGFGITLRFNVVCESTLHCWAMH